MRLTSVPLIMLFLVNSACAQVMQGPVAAKKLYFLYDDSRQHWCGYKSESEWKSEVQSRTALLVGIVEYANDRITSVKVTEQGDTGDWRVYDTYSLDKNEKLQDLKRTNNVLPGDWSEEQEFLIQNGKAIKQRSTSRSLATGKRVSPNMAVELPAVPVITNLQSFSFWPLIREKREEVSSKGKVCVPSQ